MSRAAPSRRRVSSLARAAAAAGLGWAFFFWGMAPVFRLLHWLNTAARSVGGLRWSGMESRTVQDALINARDILEAHTLFPLIFLVTLTVPLGILARIVARARVRAGFADPLDSVRRWTTSHSKATRGLVAVPGLMSLLASTLRVAHYFRHWAAYTYGDSFDSEVVRHMLGIYEVSMGALWPLYALAAAGFYVTARIGLRALVAPTIDAGEKAEEAPDRIHFDAVAVTAETRAAVGAMAVLPVVAMLGIHAARLGDAGTQAALAGYVAVAIGGTLAFRRASKVAIGVDGVFVTGSSRTRFFAYKDLDGARASHHAIELVSRGKVTLRLQLHGEDAALEAAILGRVQEAIAKAHEGASSGAGQVVQSTSDDQLARLAEGATDYRMPALTREQLWALVEGPEQDARTRTHAARALARTGNGEERARLRVAADHCAEPKVRVLLRELASGEDEEEALPEGVVVRLAR